MLEGWLRSAGLLDKESVECIASMREVAARRNQLAHVDVVLEWLLLDRRTDAMEPARLRRGCRLFQTARLCRDVCRACAQAELFYGRSLPRCADPVSLEAVVSGSRDALSISGLEHARLSPCLSMRHRRSVWSVRWDPTRTLKVRGVTWREPLFGKLMFCL